MNVNTHTADPFLPISSHYRAYFGERVQTLPLTIASTCPNRLGLKGMEICTFCDEWGSAAYPELGTESVTSQIEQKLPLLSERYRSASLLAYFQAYTNSFLSEKKLRKHIESALKHPQIRGFILGTRPDCLSKNLLTFCDEYAQSHYVSIEIGVQSFSDEDLLFLKRGHTSQQSVCAIHELARFEKIKTGIHLIFGNPNEDDQAVIETAKKCSELPIQHVKLHNLHVLKNTTLEKLYLERKFTPIELNTYAKRVILFLQHLKPDIAVQRLSALSSHWEELIAPEWTRGKLKVRQFIVDRMKEEKAFQGQYYS